MCLPARHTGSTRGQGNTIVDNGHIQGLWSARYGFVVRRWRIWNALGGYDHTYKLTNIYPYTHHPKEHTCDQEYEAELDSAQQWYRQ